MYIAQRFTPEHDKPLLTENAGGKHVTTIFTRCENRGVYTRSAWPKYVEEEGECRPATVTNLAQCS